MATAQVVRKKVGATSSSTAINDLLGSVARLSNEDAATESAMAKIVQDSDVETLLSALSESLVQQRPDSKVRTLFLRLILLGCHYKAALQPIRMRIFVSCLRHLMREDMIENLVAAEVIQVLQEELGMQSAAFSTANVLELIRQCHEEIRENQEKFSFRWLELFATLLSTIHGREIVTVTTEDGIEEQLTGPEYRSNYVEVLCQSRWNPENAASICKMLKEVAVEAPFTLHEYGQIMDKLCLSLEKLKPQEVPPLVYQMLKLSQHGSSICFIRTLAKYFTSKVKNHEMESEDMIGCNQSIIRSTMQSEGTVMFHIVHSARMSHPIGKDVIKILKCGAHAPELVLDHFVLFLSLAVSAIKMHRQSIVEGLKAALVRSVVVKLRRSQEAWFRQAVKTVPNAFVMLEQLIVQANQFGGWDLIGDGVLDLAVALLNSSPGLGKPDQKLKEVWLLGSDLLIRIIRNSSQSIKRVVEVLSSRIISSQAAAQYTECLRLLIKDALALFMENPTLLNDLVEQICSLSALGAKRVLLALLPIIKVNRSLRDSTILTLRKALFARSLEMKQIGICGVLQLLQIFKISSSLPVTQMSQASSGLSQIAVDVYKGVSTPNETLCNELMGVLRRGLSQSGQVRLKIYHGLYDVVSKNPELCNSILDVLYEHAVRQEWHKVTDTNGTRAGIIMLEKQIAEEDGRPVLTDPVGWYVHCVQQLVMKSELLYGQDDSSDTDVSFVRDKLTDLLNTWTKAYAEADLMDLNFEKNADFTSNTLEGEKNVIRVETTKNILESLMEFTITHGVGVFEETAKMLLNLFKRHSEVSALLKSSGGAKGGGGGGGNKREKKKTDDDAGEVAKKKGRNPIKAPRFQAPEHAFTLRGLSLIMRAVLVDNTPSAQPSLSILRKEPDFATFLFRMLREKQVQLDKYLSLFGSDDANNDLVLKHMSTIAAVIVEYLLVKDLENALDRNLKVVACETLLQNMQIATTHFSKKGDYYARHISLERNIDDSQKAYSSLSDKAIARITLVHDKLIEDNEERDESCNKMLASLISLLTFVVKQISYLEPEDVATNKKIYNWVKKYGETSCGTNIHVLKPYLELLFESCRIVTANSSLFLDLAREIHSKVGDLDESVQTKEIGKFSFVSKDTGETILSFICSNLEKLMDSVDLVISNCRQILNSETIGFLISSNDNLATCETNFCLMLARIVNTLSELSQSGFNLESLLDHLVRLLIKLYTTLDSVVKYFFIRSKTSREAVVASNFPKLVDLVGNSLSVRVYQLIGHIERKHKEIQDESHVGKKRADAAAEKSRVLKESKAIPNLVFKVEQFENDLIKLGSRCKLDFLQGTKRTTARDFRLVGDKLQIEKKVEEDEESSMDNDENNGSDTEENPNAESTRIGSQLLRTGLASSQITTASQMSLLRGGNLPGQEPPTKKLKIKMQFRKK